MENIEIVKKTIIICLILSYIIPILFVLISCYHKKGGLNNKNTDKSVLIIISLIPIVGTIFLLSINEDIHLFKNYTLFKFKHLKKWF